MTRQETSFSEHASTCVRCATATQQLAKMLPNGDMVIDPDDAKSDSFCPRGVKILAELQALQEQDQEDTEESVPGDTSFMYAFSSMERTEGLRQLVTVQQEIVDLADKNNRAAKASCYAFLDKAWAGERNWTEDVTGVTQSVLRAVRARKLKKDKIKEPWHIDVLYGAFFGSGDPEYLRPIVDMLKAKEHAQELIAAAEWSLNSLVGRYTTVEDAVRFLSTQGEA
jgi:hypothetical protein